jgi:DNA relaxase NicK
MELQSSSLIMDYWRFTRKVYDDNSGEIPPFEPFGVQNQPDTKAHYGYKQARRLASGGRMMWNVENPNLGVCFELSGEALRDTTWDGVSKQQVINFLNANGYRMSRIDFALDLANEHYLPIWMFDSLFQGGQLDYKARTKLKIEKQIKKDKKHHEAGGTVELGNRGSAFFMRVYDKGKEMKDLSIALTRVEAEIKKERAHAALDGMSRVGWRQFATSQIFYAFKPSAEAPQVVKDWYKGVYEIYKVAEYEPLKKHQGDINTFIRKIVLPCLKNRGAEIEPQLVVQMVDALMHVYPLSKV